MLQAWVKANSNVEINVSIKVRHLGIRVRVWGRIRGRY